MAAIDVVLVGGDAVGLENGDEGLEAGREDDEVAGVGGGDVGVGSAGGNEDGGAGADGFGAVGVAEGQLAFEDVPGFVIGAVDVERGGAHYRAIRGWRTNCRWRRKAFDHHTGVDRCSEGMISNIRAPQAPAGSREGLSPLSSM